ncbi:MAG: hypothetical protein WCP09_03625 [Candidatus Taylorbacteria bacterium]
MVNVFQSSKSKLHGTNGTELYHFANIVYKKIASKTKRRPYVRSKYFNKEKVFLDYFWGHLETKNWNDRVRRLAYYNCALDLITNNRTEPTIKNNPNKSNEILYRFQGKTKDGQRFAVQIVENIERKEKFFISIFPFT